MQRWRSAKIRRKKHINDETEGEISDEKENCRRNCTAFGGGNGAEFGCAVSGLWHLLSGETEKGMYDSQKRHKIVTKM